MFVHNIAIIIPAYHPTEKLIKLCKKLTDYPFKEIIVISDGNESKEYGDVLSMLTEMGMTILRHAVNQDKGRALKSGFNYVS